MNSGFCQGFHTIFTVDMCWKQVNMKIKKLSFFHEPFTQRTWLGLLAASASRLSGQSTTYLKYSSHHCHKAGSGYLDYMGLIAVLTWTEGAHVC